MKILINHQKIYILAPPAADRALLLEGAFASMEERRRTVLKPSVGNMTNRL